MTFPVDSTTPQPWLKVTIMTVMMPSLVLPLVPLGVAPAVPLVDGRGDAVPFLEGLEQKGLLLRFLVMMHHTPGRWSQVQSHEVWHKWVMVTARKQNQPTGRVPGDGRWLSIGHDPIPAYKMAECSAFLSGFLSYLCLRKEDLKYICVFKIYKQN